MTALMNSSKISTSDEYISHSDEAEAERFGATQGIGEVIDPMDEFTGLMMEDLSLEVNRDKP
jgi:hypothetical protein